MDIAIMTIGTTKEHLRVMFGHDLKFWKALADIVLIWALVVAGIAAVVVGLSTWLSMRWGDEISDFNERALALYKLETESKVAEAKIAGLAAGVRAGDAEIRALKAELSLQEIVKPRNLSEGAISKIASRVCPLGSQPFSLSISPNMEENADLPRQLGVLLITKCKWVLVPVSDNALKYPQSGTNGSFGVTFASGVVISYLGSNRGFADSAETLANALGDEGIAARTEPFDGTNAADNPNVISISIGSKPLIDPRAHGK